MKTPQPSEAEVLKQCLQWLKLRGVFHVRIGSGAFILGSGASRRFFRAGTPGVADVLAVMDGTPYFIEVKRPGGKQSEVQRAFQKHAEAAGAKYRIVDSLDRLIGIVEAGE